MEPSGSSSSSRRIVEASGQVVTVHKGWTVTSSKKGDEPQFHPNTLPTARQPFPAPSFSNDSSPFQAPTAGAQEYEFVDGSDPFRTRDPDVSKLIRAHAMRDSARKKKRGAQREASEGARSRDLQNDSRPETPLSFERLQHYLRNKVEIEVEKSYQTIPYARDPHPSLSAVVHDLINVSSRMYPMESAFRFNPLSPAHWFHFAQADQALYHALQYTSATYQSLYDGEVQSRRAAMEMGKCVGLLNERLQAHDEVSDGTIAATSCLALVEVSYRPIFERM